MSLEGKVAVITGGSQGIGKAIALFLAGKKADVVICDINEEVGGETVKEIEALGVRSSFFQVNVTKSEEAVSVIDKVLDNYGKIDILINNAGVTRDGLLMRMKEEDWDLVLNVNLKGTFNFTKAALKPMMKARSGKIVNIASIIGITGNAGQANYGASKAGVIALTKSTAKEVASRGINVNAVAPGFIATKMTDALPEKVKNDMLNVIPLNKFGQPEDVAKLVYFLSSDLSDYITGQTVVVSGGMVM